MGDSGTDIIVKGGSVELHFDDAVYLKDTVGDPKKHRHDGRKIIGVKVEDEDGQPLFERQNDAGLRWTITVSTTTA